MSVALLDVNVLLAMARPGHVFSFAARHWLATHRTDGWATCPITQSGFVRIASQRTGPLGITMEQAIFIVEDWRESSEHQFWPHETPLPDLLPILRAHVHGPKQITDAILLDLAIRKGGRLVTFDAKVRRLLPEDSPHQAAIEVIPT